MPYEFDALSVEHRPMAAVTLQTTFDQLSNVIIPLLNEVYAFLRSGTAAVVQTGHNIVVYLDARPTAQVGVEVSGPFPDAGRVAACSTPAGRAAHTVHVGPYARLSEAHAAVRAWCAANGDALAGPNWEIYGDWNDDPAKLITDVFYLLVAPRP